MDPANKAKPDLMFDSDSNFAPLHITAEDSDDSDWAQPEPATPHSPLPDLSKYGIQLDEVGELLELPETQNTRAAAGEDEWQRLDDAITQCESFQDIDPVLREKFKEGLKKKLFRQTSQVPSQGAEADPFTAGLGSDLDASGFEFEQGLEWDLDAEYQDQEMVDASGEQSGSTEPGVSPS